MLWFCNFYAITVLFFQKIMPSEYQNRDNQTAFILFSVEKSMLSALLSIYFLWKTRLEFLRSIDGIPPCWLVLQVLVEPCKH